MPDVVAKAMAVITGLLLVLVLGVLYVTSRPPSGSREVVAEFRDAFPTLEGFQVRTEGAPAGSVGPIKVTDKGLASVTLLVDKSVPAPKANATATIRQLDSTGDSYIAYNPGSSPKPLPEHDGKPTISCGAPGPTAPCTNTLNAPRLDDLVNAFGPEERAGVKLILQNLSVAVDERGGDINRAALRLVPALDAANKTLAEVNTQNTALKGTITNLAAVSRQAGSRRRQLRVLIDALDRTLFTTAERSQHLDRALETLPPTEAQLRTTLTKLEHTANEATPLAGDLATSAPQLSALLDKAPGFLDDTRVALKRSAPTLELTRKLLVAGAPTIAADPQRVVTGAFDLAPALSNLLKGILGGDDTIKGFFGDDKNGRPESRKDYGFGLGAVAAEPGNEPGYPDSWKNRNWVRVSAILNCATFGLPVGPGCLANALASKEARLRSTADLRPADRPAAERTPAVAAPPSGPSGPQTPSAPQSEPGRGITAPVEKVLDIVRGILPPPRKPNDSGNPASNLLDYLLR